MNGDRPFLRQQCVRVTKEGRASLGFYVESPAAVGSAGLAAAAADATRGVGKLGQAPSLAIARRVGLGVREEEEGWNQGQEEEEKGGMDEVQVE